MPILKKETDLWPANVLTFPPDIRPDGNRWHALFVKPNFDKVLMRKLLVQQKQFCGLTIQKKSRTPAGRATVSWKPLFPGYVFLYGTDSDRYDAVCTDCVLSVLNIPDQQELQRDLYRIHAALVSGLPVGKEDSVTPGQPVRVKAGPLKGQTGVFQQRAGRSRLILSLSFIQQQAWVEIEDHLIEAV